MCTLNNTLIRAKAESRNELLDLSDLLKSDRIAHREKLKCENLSHLFIRRRHLYFDHIKKLIISDNSFGYTNPDNIQITNNLVIVDFNL